MLCALGLADQLVAVSHECDFPLEVRAKPRVTRSRIDPQRMSSRAIDETVRAAIAKQESLYDLDAEMLARLAPDLIVTQQLCDVCAVDASLVAKALHAVPSHPRTVSLHPHTLEEMLGDIERLGAATGRQAEAEQLIRRSRERMAEVGRRVAKVAHRPRVICMEWFDPPMTSGHWVPEMVERAGGTDVLGKAGKPSYYVTGEQIAAAKPEILILMPCGFSIERAKTERSQLTAQPWWNHLPAVRAGRVFFVDGPAYFNGAGPRLIDGIELLAGLFHPSLFDSPSPVRAAAL